MIVLLNVGCAKASSDYKWFTSDMTILSVSAYGIIQAKRPGIATVKVVSTFDSQNFDEVHWLYAYYPSLDASTSRDNMFILNAQTLL